ncbi:MAG TPA: hypothetical protein PKK10_13550 [Woeseiaceae bacterium]|nr:hypothetical protein [Woeseiaceae bacterium]
MKDRKSQNSTRNKPGYGARFGQRLREAGEFGRGAIREPRALPGQAHGAFRRWFRKVWSVRGGGLYAAGYALTFLWFEVQSFTDDVWSSHGIGDFVEHELISLLLRFSVDAITNMVKAFMWPVYAAVAYPPWGAIALGLAFALFPVYLKKPIEKWLFADDDEQDSKPA